MRSGFADYVSFSLANIITLYPSEKLWRMFRIWNTVDFKNHYEIIYQDDISDRVYRAELITQIVEVISKKCEN